MIGWEFTLSGPEDQNFREVTLPHAWKPSEYPNRLITGYLPDLPGRVTVKGYIGGKETCSYSVKTAGPAVRPEFDFEEIRLETYVPWLCQRSAPADR